jgi:two-component system, NarL family, response regulator
MLTISDTEEDIYQANLAGVSGYLTKEADSITLLRAIRTVAQGGSYFPPEVKEKIQSRENREALSPRESEILHLIVKGMSNKEIGGQLNITEGTTKLHVARILAKVGAADRTRAAILAVERGLIRL